MQITTYYGTKDQYLLDLVDRKARRNRKSRSAEILTILEEHFARGKKLGEILVDLGAVTYTNLSRALDLQKSKSPEKLLGDILLEESLVEKEELDRAIMIQGRTKNSRG